MSKIEPALTAEEWRGGWASNDAEAWAHLDIAEDVVVVEGPHDYTPAHLDADGRHALAALCLHGQPFGFTREDVKAMRDVAMHGPQTGVQDVEAVLRSIADRIEALLPPEEP